MSKLLILGMIFIFGGLVLTAYLPLVGAILGITLILSGAILGIADFKIKNNDMETM